MNHVVKATLIIVGLINFVPVVGVISAEMLSSLYAIPSLDGDLLVLMRHRALMLGVLGALLIASAFVRSLQTPMMIAGLISMLGFVVIAYAEGQFGAKVENVALVDLFASALLIVAVVIRWRVRSQGDQDPTR